MVEVETTEGRIQGVSQGGINVFRGIPYARPPVEGLRFRRPQRHTAWSESRDATRFGPAAPQNADPLDHLWGGFPVAPHEDCLTLNVWTPGLDDSRRPVMVWLHGGAFVIGSGSEYWFEGTRLARRGDVVVVTINYRLGVFGFLDLSETEGKEYEESGNCGLLDQVAALEWVRENIERFGGDPQNVTIFGESAGAVSVSCLMAMPKARGLFHRAIAQSGGPNLVRSRDVSHAVARAFLKSLGIRDVDRLRSVPMRTLLKAQARFLKTNEFGGDAVFGPVVDGDTLPERPLHAIRSGSARNVALLAGATRDEARLWSLYAPILRWTRPHALERVLTHVVGDRWREVVDAYAARAPKRAPVTSPWRSWATSSSACR